MALDAGCGRISLLRPFRERIERLVGVDVHAPAEPLPHLDEFRLVDLCGPRDAFPPGTFDVVLSSFTIEHLAEPGAAFANIREWLAPGGVLIATTVNRRHPFVAAYLGLPTRLRRVLQPVVKSSAADAHPLVGACNDPRTIAESLEAAGFREVRMTTVGHLARAWGRHWPTFVVGLTGDVLTRDAPTRRSTIVAVARA
jgi:SAM-dependent methyltransferase